MERKIGEIFEYNGDWYQCVEGAGCYQCDFNRDGDTCIADDPHCTCRSDKKDVVFKKLEKVGEPYTTFVNKTVQNYLLETAVSVPPKDVFTLINNEQRLIAIEIKQTKEDMEEKKQKLDKLVDDYMACRIQYAEFDKEIKALYDKEDSEPTLKEFDLEAARSGKPVCTRDGRKARIICFDRRLFYKNVSYPILAVVERSDGEDDVCGYNEKGKVLIEDGAEYKDDLMMLPEKKEGWIVIHKEAIYDKETAEKIARETTANVIKIQKIEWEE